MQSLSHNTEENTLSKSTLICGILAVIGIFTGLPGVALGIATLILAGRYKKIYGVRSSYTRIGYYCGLTALILAALNTIRLFFTILRFIRYSSLIMKYFPQLQDSINNFFN